MDQLLFDINQHLASFEPIKYVLIFLAVFIEGPLATVVAASIAAGGTLELGTVFLAAGLGNLAADMSWYALGYAGRHTRVMHWFPWLGNQESTIRHAEEQMHDFGLRILVASKLWFGIASIPTLIAAGLLHFPWYRLLPAVVACEIVWTGCLVSAGYYGAEYLGRIENIMEGMFAFAAVTLGSALIYVAARKKFPHVWINTGGEAK